VVKSARAVHGSCTAFVWSKKRKSKERANNNARRLRCLRCDVCCRSAAARSIDDA
jgi:hypothetical protein